MVNALYVLRKSTFPELLVLFENVSKMKLLSDLLNDFFFPVLQLSQESVLCKVLYQQLVSVNRYCRQKVACSTAYFQCAMTDAIVYLFKKSFFHSDKTGQAQHRHKETCPKFEGQISQRERMVATHLLPFCVQREFACLLCLGFLSHAKSMDREYCFTLRKVFVPGSFVDLFLA